MTNLAELQGLFRDALLGNRDALDAVSRRVAARPELSSEEHVLIYRRSVFGALTRSLSEVFPVTRRLVGEAFFDAMAARFIPDTPSRSPDLADYGAELPGFIGRFEPAAELPYLADVALLEWLWHRAFHAADATALDTAALANEAETPARIVFRLPPSAGLLESAYPIRRIWQVNQPDHAGDDRIDLDAGGERLMVWRASVDELRIDSLSPSQWRLLAAIDAGETLERLGELPDIAELLPACAARGWLAGFELR